VESKQDVERERERERERGGGESGRGSVSGKVLLRGS